MKKRRVIKHRARSTKSAMKLKLYHDGRAQTVTSEAAAKRLARKWLGASRLSETPTHDGWQYWDATNKDEDAPNVTVKVL